MRLLIAATWAFAATVTSQPHAQVTQTFRYDAQGRLSGVATALPAGSRVSNYNYDDADSRTERNQWDTGNTTFTNTLPSERNLVPTQRLLSPNGQVEFKFEQDGNIVLREGATVLWQNGTSTGTGLFLQMQLVGNLVLYRPGVAPIWATPTDGNTGAYLQVRDNGTAVVLNSAGTTVLWEVP
jgi:YD repeat-containing protein